jgi:hypothetical protein
MGSSEGTNPTTGTVELTAAQKRALDAKLVKFFVRADKTTDGLITEGIALITDCQSGNVWTEAKDSDGKAFEDGAAWLVARMSAAPKFHKVIAQAWAVVMLEQTKVNAKGNAENVFTMRQIEQATGASRGTVFELAKEVKTRVARTAGDGKELTEDQKKAAEGKKLVTRSANTLEAVRDGMENFTPDQMVTVARDLRDTLGSLIAQYRNTGNGDLMEAVKVAIAADAAKTAA